MIQNEYLSFLQTLNHEQVPDSVKKLANLINVNLHDIAALTTHQGQRIKRVVSLSKQEWNNLDTQLPPAPEQHDTTIGTVSRLKSITVGPFRGFSRPESFDLNSRMVLIYGPNGTGKSSFCEALEYALLGNVLEADSKRFRDQRQYLTNAFTNQFSPPEITCINNLGDEEAIVPNEGAYRFCFIEKNRIDSFSRIAAQAPARQTELISTLFGLESFTDFIRNFTAEIDGKYIDLFGAKGLELHKKRQFTAGAQQQIDQNKAELTKIAEEEQTLAAQYRNGITFSQLVTELRGDGTNPGVIQSLTKELQLPLGVKSNLTQTALSALSDLINTTTTSLQTKQKELAEASQQVSFKQLYEAILALQPSMPNECPACHTPLTQVTRNPYSNASGELEKLQQLTKIQEEIARLNSDLNNSLINLKQIVDTCLRFYNIENSLTPFQLHDQVQPKIGWWHTLFTPLQDGTTGWEHLTVQVKALEQQDKEVDQQLLIRAQKQKQLENIQTYDHSITALATRKDTANKAITASQKIITNFEKENAELIADVEKEKVVVQTNNDIVEAYRFFVQQLNNYGKALPAKLVADLGEGVVNLYNSFNRNDSDSELLAAVKLPLAQNKRLEIAFKASPETYHDALHVLSEGHIRCLGLAILLAKNLKEQSPIIIFDDPVNAIDDDHRESIRKTLFEDPTFSDKQILLTCHGEEFYKDIHNLLPAQEANAAKSYTFLPRLGEPHIRVDFNCSPRNYILSARSCIDRNQVREALAKSRQALESLSAGKIWQYVHRFGDGHLSLKFRAASAPIELRNLAEQLKSKIGKGDFSDPNKERVYTPLDNMLGPNGNSREWRYLNKGTHEEIDRAEFDRHTVEAIIMNLELLDQALAP